MSDSSQIASDTPITSPNVRLIPLSQGKCAIVDAELYEWLSQWKWSYFRLKNRNAGYAIRTINRSSCPRESIMMHRVIINAGKGQQVDHRDCDGLNNTKANLRLCTNAQNQANKPKYNKPTSSRFKGVFWDKRVRKWGASIAINNKRKNLGRFLIEEDAARAYDEAAREIQGEFARTNF